MPDKRILVLSDLHCGSMSGLTPIPWQMDKMAFIQGPLWDWYEKTVKAVGCVDVCIVNGDAVDGEGKAETIWHITTDIEEQAVMAAEAIGKVKAKRVYFTYGTPFHTVGSLSYENIAAKQMGAAISDTLFLDVNGARFSFRHVTGSAGTPYTHGTQAYKEAVRDLLDAVENDAEPADVVVRSHVHNYFRAESPERVAITTPALQIPVSVFGRKCRTWRYHIGVVLFTVSDKGQVNIEPFIMPLKLTRPREYIAI